MNLPSLLSRFFPGSRGKPDPQKIADPPAISAIGVALLPALVVLKLLAFGKKQIKALLGKAFPGQRSTTEAYVAVLRRRPDVAKRTGIDPEVLQQIIDKDETLDLLGHTLTQFRTIVSDATLILRAALSMWTGKVLTYVRTTLAGTDITDPGQRRLRVAFNAIDFSINETQAAKTRQKKGQARKHKPLQQQLDAARHDLSLQPQIARLQSDAEKGVDLTWTPGQAKGLAAKKGHKKNA